MRITSLFTSPASSSNSKRLGKRKGGGGGGKGGSSGGKSSGSSGKTGSGSSGSSGGTKSSLPVSSLPGGKSSATAYGSGGGRQVTIASGQPFAGRTAGGASRSEVYGSSVYGSGYPGVAGRGVVGRGFPFYFWPIVWGGAATGAVVGGTHYLHDQDEYGNPDNSSRPGGVMTQAQFQSNSTGTTFHVLADNSTLVSLIDSIRSNCTDLSSNSSTAPASYNGSSSTDPQPEQAIQYYRSSSVVLTLDGYNNSAALSDNENTTATPLPSGIDTTLLDCLNSTIGDAVPLVDAAVAGSSAALLASKVGTLGLAWVLLCIMRTVL